MNVTSIVDFSPTHLEVINEGTTMYIKKAYIEVQINPDDSNIVDFRWHWYEINDHQRLFYLDWRIITTPSVGSGTALLAAIQGYLVSGMSGIKIDQTPDTGTYYLLSGTVNGINTVFTVSAASYTSGSLTVYRNGDLLTQGSDWTETSPAAGTFTFIVAPLTGNVITAIYGVSLAGYISSFTESDTNTIDLVFASGVLSGNVRKQNTTSINLTDNASGLKADANFGTTAGTIAEGNDARFANNSSSAEGDLGTLTWTATAAPSGTINKKYRWTRVQNQITFFCKIDASVAGLVVTSVSFALPGAMPTPATFASQPNSTIVTIGSGIMASTANPAVSTIIQQAKLYRDGSGNYIIEIAVSASLAATHAWCTIHYTA